MVVCNVCLKDQINGTLTDGKFICADPDCQLKSMVKKIAHKEVKDYSIIDCLKKHGIPGNVAKIYYDKYGTDYLVKRIWLFSYHSEKDCCEIKNNVGWLRTIIEYPKHYPESKGFRPWLKIQQANYRKGDFSVLYRNI